ncbi:MAG TPA: Fe-S cluster assembly protein SufD [Candidatus Tumulicola sp.]|nr:Fe-S cluster assembly protein SufD [Candidatus Tumulicola sp.]
MTETLIKNAVDAEIIKTISASEPAWLRELRLGAFERYASLPTPTDRTPGWRRLKLDGISFDPPAPAPSSPSWEIGSENERKGVFLGHLSACAKLEAFEPLIREELTRRTPASSLEKFSSLVQCAWRIGCFVYVPDGVEATEPIRLGYFDYGPYPRTLIILGKNARLTLTEQFAKGYDFTAGLTTLVLGDGAHLTYAHVQECEHSAVVFSHQHARIGRDAKLVTLNFGLGGRLAKSDVEVELLGRGAHSDMLGLIFAEGSQQFDYHTLQGHRSPDTRSDLLFKAALDDESHSVYTGVIIIEKGAQRSDAYQANRNLLLGANARADTEPKLEIEADDVRCTHGATVGPIDEEQLFYLQSRGLDEDSASRLVVDGFFQDVLDRVGDPRVTDPLREKVWPHLGRLGAH